MQDLEKQLFISGSAQRTFWSDASIEDFCRRIQNGLENVCFEQKRKLVELLIDRVIVQNENVEIRYVIPTSQPANMSVFVNCGKTISIRNAANIKPPHTPWASARIQFVGHIAIPLATI